MFKLIFGFVVFGIVGTASAQNTEKFICVGGVATDSKGKIETVGFFDFAPSYSDNSIYIAQYTTNNGYSIHYPRGSFNSYLKNPSAEIVLSAQTTFADTVNGVPYKTYEVSLEALKTAAGNYILTYEVHILEENRTYSIKFEFPAGSCRWY